MEFHSDALHRIAYLPGSTNREKILTLRVENFELRRRLHSDEFHVETRPALELDQIHKRILENEDLIKHLEKEPT